MLALEVYSISILQVLFESILCLEKLRQFVLTFSGATNVHLQLCISFPFRSSKL